MRLALALAFVACVALVASEMPEDDIVPENLLQAAPTRAEMAADTKLKPKAGKVSAAPAPHIAKHKAVLKAHMAHMAGLKAKHIAYVKALRKTMRHHRATGTRMSRAARIKHMKHIQAIKRKRRAAHFAHVAHVKRMQHRIKAHVKHLTMKEAKKDAAAAIKTLHKVLPGMVKATVAKEVKKEVQADVKAEVAREVKHAVIKAEIKQTLPKAGACAKTSDGMNNKYSKWCKHQARLCFPEYPLQSNPKFFGSAHGKKWLGQLHHNCPGTCCKAQDNCASMITTPGFCECRSSVADSVKARRTCSGRRLSYMCDLDNAPIHKKHKAHRFFKRLAKHFNRHQPDKKKHITAHQKQNQFVSYVKENCPKTCCMHVHAQKARAARQHKLRKHRKHHKKHHKGK